MLQNIIELYDICIYIDASISSLSIYLSKCFSRFLLHKTCAPQKCLAFGKRDIFVFIHQMLYNDNYVSASKKQWAHNIFVCASLAIKIGSRSVFFAKIGKIFKEQRQQKSFRLLHNDNMAFIFTPITNKFQII